MRLEMYCVVFFKDTDVGPGKYVAKVAAAGAWGFWHEIEFKYERSGSIVRIDD